jgi:hypothetical protein
MTSTTATVSAVPIAKSSNATPKVTGTVRSKNPLKGAVEILPVSLSLIDVFVVCW